MGIRNAVQWNSDLYNQVCPSGTDCVASYSIADQILASLVDTCPSCEYGIDTTKASRSVNVLAESLLGYCYQTEQLIYNATGWYSGYAVDYATIWKLTLMDYNAGSQCVITHLNRPSIIHKVQCGGLISLLMYPVICVFGAGIMPTPSHRGISIFRRPRNNKDSQKY